METLNQKINVVYKDTVELKPYERNAKKHSKKQIQGVADSIEAFGWQQPLVVDNNNVIVIGHCRYEAAKLLKISEIPCLIADDLTDDQIKALRIADNKLNESPWIMELVVSELQTFTTELKALTGFELSILSPPRQDDDNIPEVTDIPQSQLGQLYQLGKHRLMCGDSTNIQDIQKLLDGNVADMAFTDPPYNIDYDQNQSGIVQSGIRKAKFGKILNDKMTDESFEQFISDVFLNLQNVLKEGASFYISSSRESTITFNLKLKEIGFHIAQWLVWKKENFNISRLSYHPMHEIITYGWKKGRPHIWNNDRKQRDVLEFSRMTAQAVHPTEKPVSLLEYLIRNSSRENDLVIDLFGGSGSTLIAAEKSNRKAYLMELDPKYVDVILTRFENYTHQKPVLLNHTV